MFSSKQDVDHHVKALLKISKNSFDTDIQCKAIAQLYFDVCEFEKAKYYIERYLKVKSNSEPGLLLKAKVHEQLDEQLFALGCFETLYRISNKNDYIDKVCDSLIKCNVPTNKAKMWIDIIEAKVPQCEQLSLLKAHFYTRFDSFVDELTRLELMLKSDTTNQYKRRYLTILTKATVKDNVLPKCIDMINNYNVLDDVDLVRSCVKIFRIHISSSTDPLFKQLYSIVLIAIIALHRDSSTEHLSELYALIVTGHTDPIYQDLTVLFLYHLIACAHYSAINTNTMSKEVTQYLFHGYVSLNITKNQYVTNTLSQSLYTWLQRQCCTMRSIIYHMKVHSLNHKMTRTMKIHSSLLIICNLIWPYKLSEYEELERMFQEHSMSVTINDNEIIVQQDLECYSEESVNLDLILWQLVCHLDLFRCTMELHDVEVTQSAVHFLISLINYLFPMLEIDIEHRRNPENICQVDLITFLLGAMLTYRKSIIITNNTIYGIPIPFEGATTMFAVVGILEKWWNVVVDYLLKPENSCCTDADRELLKTGLEIVQVVDCKLSETVQLQLGRCLAKFASNCKSEKDAVLKRSAYFLDNALRSHAEKSESEKSIFDVFPVKRPKNFNSPFGASKTVLSFDTVFVSDDVIDKWRFDAYLFLIDRKLELNESLDGIKDLVSQAAKINSSHPSLCLLKSKLYLTYATRTCDTYEYNFLMTLAVQCADQCHQYLNSLPQLERTKVESLLQDLQLVIGRAKEQEQPIPLYTDSSLNITATDVSNSNWQARNQQAIMTDDPTDLWSFDFDPRYVDNTRYRMDQLEMRVNLIDSANLKMTEQMNYCLERCDDIKRTVQHDEHDVKLLKYQTESYNNLSSMLSTELENLARKFDKFTVTENIFEKLMVENVILKRELQQLVGRVDGLDARNSTLNCNLNALQQSINNTPVSVTPQLVMFKQRVGNELTNIGSVIRSHLTGFDKVEAKFLTDLGEQEEREKHCYVKKERLTRKGTKNGISRKNGSKIQTGTSDESSEKSCGDVMIICDSYVTDEWDCVFSIGCEFCSLSTNNWTDCGYGLMKILRETQCGKLTYWLSMTLEMDNMECYRHVVVKHCPVFRVRESGSTTLCWYVDDPNGGTELVAENFALRFQSENQLEQFVDKIRYLQSQIDDDWGMLCN